MLQKSPNRESALPESVTIENAAFQSEFEIKFSTDDAGLRRVLAFAPLRGCAPSRARTLTTHYFDTEDGRLLRRGISLRLRVPMRGESVMTFKAPARGGRSFLERLEVARPAPEGRFDLHAFDETTRAMIEDATGGLDLVERYSTVFKRRLLTLNMGRSEIEIALDAGHFLIGQVRAPLFEVEFELKAGERADAIDLARRVGLDAGLRLETVSKSQRCALMAGLHVPQSYSPPGEAIHDGLSLDTMIVQILSDCLRHFVAHIQPFRDEQSPRSVHQMRVALRRMRAVLKTFARSVPEASFRAFADRARDIAKGLGPARDCDAFRQLAFEEALAHPRHPDDVANLNMALAAERTRAYEAASALLESPSVLTFILDLQAYVSRRGWRGEATDARFLEFSLPAAPFARQALDALLRKARKNGKNLLTRTDEERHELRIVLKSLRYNCDFFAGIFAAPTQAKIFISSLGRLQDLLGSFNDLAGAEAMMDRLARTGPAFPRAAGFILGWYACQGDQADRQIASAWRDLKQTEPFWT